MVINNTNALAVKTHAVSPESIIYIPPHKIFYGFYYGNDYAKTVYIL